MRLQAACQLSESQYSCHQARRSHKSARSGAGPTSLTSDTWMGVSGFTPVLVMVMVMGTGMPAATSLPGAVSNAPAMGPSAVDHLVIVTLSPLPLPEPTFCVLEPVADWGTVTPLVVVLKVAVLVNVAGFASVPIPVGMLTEN